MHAAFLTFISFENSTNALNLILSLQGNIQKLPSSKNLETKNITDSVLHKTPESEKISAKMKYSDHKKLSKLNIFGDLARFGNLAPRLTRPHR